MASPSGEVLRANEVRVAVQLMLNSWAAKVTSAMGSKQVANDISEDFERNYRAEWWQGEIPSWEGGDKTKEQYARDTFVRGAVTLKAAFEIIDEAALAAVTRYEAQLRARKKPMRRRRWVSMVVGKRVMGRERLIARAALSARVFKKRKRTGWQTVSTTRRSVPRAGWFKFGGRNAVARPLGRPPLPESLWLRRYEARRAKRRRREGVKFTRRRAVKIPPTVHPRFPFVLPSPQR